MQGYIANLLEAEWPKPLFLLVSIVPLLFTVTLHHLWWCLKQIALQDKNREKLGFKVRFLSLSCDHTYQNLIEVEESNIKPMTSIWRKNINWYFSMDITCSEQRTEESSFPRAKVKKNCDLQGTDNIQGQTSVHIF